MLSREARNLLNIPLDALLPASLPDLYDRWFSGKKYSTPFTEGWIFNPRGLSQMDSYDTCIDHRTAQFYFALDHDFRVLVKCAHWIQIASSFISLVEQDAILVASNARPDRSRNLGKFPSIDHFKTHHRDYLAPFHQVPTVDSDFSTFFRGPNSIISTFRFYTDEFVIGSAEYFL